MTINRTSHARYAPVAPLPLLREMWAAGIKDSDEQTIHGPYHLLLAHDVLKDADHRKDYGRHFAEVAEYYDGSQIIIMDNSIVELGDAVDMEMIAEAGAIVRANVLVLPDVMGDGHATIKKYYSMREDIQQVDGNFELMAVPQGPTLPDFARCLETYIENPLITWIGVPRIATAQLGTRKSLIELCGAMNPNWSLHLLGFSNNVIDDILCSHQSGQIEGIDSAVPVRAGQKDMPFRVSQSDYGERGDYWENPGTLRTVTVENIKLVRSYVGR